MLLSGTFLLYKMKIFRVSKPIFYLHSGRGDCAQNGEPQQQLSRPLQRRVIYFLLRAGFTHF
jgi:hypothetical protein